MHNFVVVVWWLCGSSGNDLVAHDDVVRRSLLTWTVEMATCRCYMEV